MSRIDVLFVHNNFPAQFRNLARTFSASPDIRVRAIGAGPAPGLEGVDLQRYDLTARGPQTVHAFARRFERESRRAEQVIYAANSLRLSGFEPKLIYVHPGWGEALPLRSLFPDATICCYAEFYYWPFGADVGFDKEFPSLGVDGEVRVSLWNAATLLALVDADFAIAPTIWQRSVFPKELRPKIHVLHDGFDLGALQGRPPKPIRMGELDLAPGDEIVTFVARNLEPYRGFHVFMRALPRLLAARPKARICIVGGDQVSYGSAPVGHPNWRTALVEEMRASLDLSRVHFLGTLPYERYLDLLRLSSAHVYLTYPFVLSWSMLEAMALGCLIIGSDTPPVGEVVSDGVNGRLVPFFEPDRLADTIAETLGDPSKFAPLRAEAARSAASYDFASAIWPKHVALLEDHLMSRALLDTIRSLKPLQTKTPPA
jgi:glycosyltransferase involved in cell wall biosynthesis